MSELPKEAGPGELSARKKSSELFPGGVAFLARFRTRPLRLGRQDVKASEASGGVALLGPNEIIMPQIPDYDPARFERAVDGLPPIKLPRSELKKSMYASLPWHSGEHSFALHAMSRQKRKKAA